MTEQIARWPITQNVLKNITAAIWIWNGLSTKDRLWILQARPETVWSKKNKAKKSEEETVMDNCGITTYLCAISRGIPGHGGRQMPCHHRSERTLDTFKEGEVLVTTMKTSPDWHRLAMKEGAVAIVTDAGGMTCHASIVSRELGIPCVVEQRAAVEADVKVEKQDRILPSMHATVLSRRHCCRPCEERNVTAQAAGTTAVRRIFPRLQHPLFMNPAT